MTTLLSLVLHPVAQALGWTLLHFLWQGALLGLLAWLALALLRGANSKARYGMACTFLVLMVAAPLATFLTLEKQASPSVEHLTLKMAAAASLLSTAPADLPFAQRLKAALDPSLPWLLLGWAAGVLLLSARFLGGWVRVQRLRRRSAVPVPAEWHMVLSHLCRELKLSRTVRLLQSAAVEVPTALGWLRPVILLPACALTGLAPLQLEAILAHELAHIRRGDFLVNLLQSLVEVLLFYHPAVWWLSSRIRAERELCCDDVAAAHCGDPLLLARALTDLEALREPIQPPPSHLALAANGGSLMHRVRHLLHPALPITSGARATALAVLAASLLGAAGVAFQDKAPEAPAKPAKATRIRMADDQRKLDVHLQGDVRLNGEAPEPVTVSGDGSFRVEETKGGKTRSYSALKDKATYKVDGQAKALDKEGQDWLRAIVTETVKAQAGREQARTLKLRAEKDRAEGTKDRARAEGHREQVVEIHTRHLKDLEAQTKDLEAMTKDLDIQLKELSPEERARVHAELDQAKAELDKARAEGRQVRVEMIKEQGEGPDTVIIRKERHGQEEAGKHIEIQTEDVGPGVVVIRKKVDGKDVVEKHVRLRRKGGDPKEEEAWAFQGPDGEDAFQQDIHIPEIHIPRIHVRPFAHPGGDDRQLEMTEIQAELRALQARLDQLQKEVGRTPKPPIPPKTPKAPKSAHPAVPPPPPPPAPDAPPPPPAAPPAPPAPPAPGM